MSDMSGEKKVTEPEPRSTQRVGKMLQSLFNIFSVAQLTVVELDNYEKHLLHVKHRRMISDVSYDTEMRKVYIAKKIVSLITDIEQFAKEDGEL